MVIRYSPLTGLGGNIPIPEKARTVAGRFFEQQFNPVNFQYMAHHEKVLEARASASGVATEVERHYGRTREVLASEHTPGPLMHGLSHVNWRPVMSIGGGAWSAYDKYKALLTPEEGYQPSMLEKAGAGAQALGVGAFQVAADAGIGYVMGGLGMAVEGMGLGGTMAAGLGIAMGGLELAISSAIFMGPAAVGISASLLNARREQGGYIRRNWYKPNLAPIYGQNALSSRQQGLEALGSSSQFLGSEARYMASRRY